MSVFNDWPDLVVRPEDRRILLCPTADEDEHLSYSLHYGLSRMSPLPPSVVMLVAENQPNSNKPDFIHTPRDGPPRFNPHRHDDLGSNYLWQDFHVTSEPVPPPAYEAGYDGSVGVDASWNDYGYP